MADGRVNNGGRREGAGRKSTKHEFVDDGLETPLMYMLKVMRAPRSNKMQRMEAAKAAAPYCHSRLQQIDAFVEADLNIMLVSYLDDRPTADH